MNDVRWAGEEPTYGNGHQIKARVRDQRLEADEERNELENPLLLRRELRLAVGARF